MQGYNLKDYFLMKVAAASLDDTERYGRFCRKALSASIFSDLSGSRVWFQLSPSLLPAHEAGRSSGQSFASHSCLSKRNGQTHAHASRKLATICRGEMSGDAAVELVVNSKQQLRGHTVPWPHRVAPPLPGCLAQQAPSDTHTHTRTRWEIVGQNQGLNVVWNSKPIFNWDLNSPVCGGKYVNCPENELRNQ